MVEELEKEIIEGYANELSELTSNAKPRINLLTMLADENQEYAPAIIRLIENQVFQAQPACKLPLLYLIDSIVKNCSKDAPYRDLFAKKIADIFVHTFRQVDEETRKRMYNLRQTWPGIFPNSRLYMIDVKVHEIDPAWPISEAALAGRDRITAAGPLPAAGTTTIHVNPRFVGGPPSQPVSPVRPAAPSAPVTVASRDPRQQRQQAPLPPATVVRGNRSAELLPAKQPPVTKNVKPQVNEVSSTAGDLIEEITGIPAPPPSKEPVLPLPPKKRKHSSQDDSQPTDVLPDKRPTPPAPVASRPPRFDRDRDSRRPRRDNRHAHHQQQQISPNRSIRRPPLLVSPSHQQWNQYKTTRAPDTPLFSPEAAPPPDWQQLPQGDQNMQAFLAVDAVRLMNQAQHRLNAGVINQHQYDELMRDLQRLQAAMPPQAMMMTGMGPEEMMVHFEQANPDQVPFGVDNAKHFPALQEVQRSPDREESSTPPHQARLLSGIELPNLHAPPVPPGPPAIPPHKRIYVDGRAYEVQYFKDERGRDVGVIERNALPHRIRFVGNPRQVIIDGTPYTLSFGEKMTVFIDGQAHLMEFGGPSRELYLGRQPLRGSFGGPPIVVKINGVEHRIQLTGPPPEVKIDPEPDYSLARYMQNRPLKLKKPIKIEPVEIPLPPNYQGLPNPMGFGPQMLGAQATSIGPPPGYLPHQQMGPSMGMGMMGGPAPMHAGPPPNVQDLVNKLISAGMLKKQQEEAAAAAAAFEASNFVIVEDLINKRTRGEATPDLKECKMDLLKIRYAAEVDQLYPESGPKCTICGLRFPEGNDAAKRRHHDWHFEQNKRENRRRPPARNWYFAAEDWVNFAESEQEVVQKAKSVIFEQQHQQQQLLTATGYTGQQVIMANDKNQNCSGCGEKFDQVYDDEEEGWKLKGAVEINGKTYHPVCYEEPSANESTPVADAPPPIPAPFIPVGPPSVTVKEFLASSQMEYSDEDEAALGKTEDEGDTTPVRDELE